MAEGKGGGKDLEESFLRITGEDGSGAGLAGLVEGEP
jgi:hypothetical protein